MDAEENRKAFLSMLAVSEGTKGRGDDGYNVLFGGGVFNSYADHPRQFLTYHHGETEITSSAAGRYQILVRIWDAYRKILDLPDFSPASQDAVALQLIRERRALEDIDAGDIVSAITKCKNIWASLPGAGYGQHEQKLSTLLSAYLLEGGKVA